MYLKKTIIIGVITSLYNLGFSQNIIEDTQIKGFVHFNMLYDIEKETSSFAIGEQDLFITSQVTDKLSFLGESVFKYNPNKGFNASIERIIFKYNYYRNHNFLFGKHHTPLNFWNDVYHHGRVFFPTIDRPILFSEGIIPIHTTGASLQGQNLGKLKFGYDLMFGNGISTDDRPMNSNKNLSTSLAIHIKPIDEMRIGASFYHDKIDSLTNITTSHSHGPPTVLGREAITQNLLTGYISYFGDKFELISESTFSFNKGENSGQNNTTSHYTYFGYKVKERNTLYLRYDVISYEKDEVYYSNENKNSFIAGVRHELNYRSVVKLEYQHNNFADTQDRNVIKTQIAIGF